eukprot:1008857-Prymnesium_polylepis.1
MAFMQRRTPAPVGPFETVCTQGAIECTPHSTTQHTTIISPTAVAPPSRTVRPRPSTLCSVSPVAPASSRATASAVPRSAARLRRRRRPRSTVPARGWQCPAPTTVSVWNRPS